MSLLSRRWLLAVLTLSIQLSAVFAQDSPSTVQWIPEAAATVLLRDDFNTISSSTWSTRDSFQARSGTAQCIGPTRSSNCYLATARTFGPGVEIETRIQTSGGCNCGFTGLSFGKVGSSAYEVRVECDGWGLDCAQLRVYNVANGQGWDKPVYTHKKSGMFACLTNYKMVVRWLPTSLKITVKDDNQRIVHEATVSGAFSRTGSIGFVGYDCDGGSAVDSVEVRELETSPTATIEAGDGSACGGGTTVLPVRVNGASSMLSAQFELVFDSSKLTIANVTTGSMTSAFSHSSNAVSSGRVRVAMASGSAASGTSGEIARVTVAPASTFTTGLSASIQIQNATVNDGTAAGSAGTVSCTNACRLGDVNDNGAVTALDASLILQAVVGARLLNARETCAADYNQNGNVTSLDASQVLQCVVGSGPCR